MSEIATPAQAISRRYACMAWVSRMQSMSWGGALEYVRRTTEAERIAATDWLVSLLDNSGACWCEGCANDGARATVWSLPLDAWMDALHAAGWLLP